MWWSKITKLFAFTLSFKIISFHIFNLQPVYFMSIFKMKLYFYILPRLYISIIIEQLANKVQVFVRKKEKRIGLLSTLIFELNQMNSNKIIDGGVGFAAQLFIHFMKISSTIHKIFETNSNFHVKQRTTEKFNFCFQRVFFQY